MAFKMEAFAGLGGVLRKGHPGHDPDLPPCPLCGARAYKGYRFTRPDDIEHDCDCAYTRWDEYYAGVERAWRRWYYPRLYRASLPEGYRELLGKPFRVKGNEGAAEAVEAWTLRGGLLYVYGPPGAGKTHLAVRAGWRRAESGRRVAFFSEIDLMEEARRLALGGEGVLLPGGSDLVVDGLGTARATPLAAETVYLLLEGARSGRFSLLATGTLPPEDLARRFGDVADALLARLEGRAVPLRRTR